MTETEQGRTFGELLEHCEYGGKGFADSVTYGKCEMCRTDLPAYRGCATCAYNQFERLGKNCFVEAYECREEQHQKEMKIMLCEECGGPKKPKAP